jgi:hypothetical protein
MDICHAMPMAPQLHSPYVENMFDQPLIQPYGIGSGATPPPININVVTGNDNKVGSEPASAPKKVGMIQGGSADTSLPVVTTTQKQQQQQQEQPIPTPESKEKSFWGGILEGAGNIFVKKTG